MKYYGEDGKYSVDKVEAFRIEATACPNLSCLHSENKSLIGPQSSIE